MKAALWICLSILSCGTTVFAQQAGVAAVWDTAQNIGQFVTGAQRLKPLLEQMTPREWVAQGASQTYLSQYDDAHKELEYLEAAAKLFQRDPEKLTSALDTLFRWQNMEFRMESLIEAVRKYQNPAVGDLILSVLRSNSGNRDGLRQYISELAALKEREAAINEEDAQRCRADLLRPSAAPPKSTPPKPATPSPAKGNTQK